MSGPFTVTPPSAEVQNKIKQEQREEIIFASTATIGSLYLVVKAVRAAKRGDYAKATYYATLWVGFTNNANASHRERQRQKEVRGY